jgi:bis(5'-nucleosidyl)-tetraphosphatase
MADLTESESKQQGRAEGRTQGRTRQERSAGVILYRHDPAAPGGKMFLLLDYGKYWDYPKGHVEKGEDDQAAALRELEEETGIGDAQIVSGFTEEIVYFFRHPKRGLVRKTVLFFLASTDTADVKLSHEHVGYEWLPAEDALKRVKYPTAKQVFRSASAFLSRQG